MTLNGRPITGMGETMGMDVAQDAGTPLPSRPVRAEENCDAAWNPPDAVAGNADSAPTDPKGSTSGHIGGWAYDDCPPVVPANADGGGSPESYGGVSAPVVRGRSHE